MNQDLSAYRIIAKFDANIRRPKPMQSGMTAMLFGENGADADEINKLGQTAYQDALVAVEMFEDGEAREGFYGYVRRPEPSQSGMVAKFFGENGKDADVITSLGLTEFNDIKMTFQIRFIQDPEGKEMKQEKGPYSEQSVLLYKSVFFARKEVWEKIGTDDDYLAWVGTQSCCINAKKFGVHKGDVVAMHVRRIEHGSGTSIKPKYSAIPGCWGHHQNQHDNGESAVGGREYYDKQRIRHLKLWCWKTLTTKFGFESMTFVKPSEVLKWAKENRVDSFLPYQYQKWSE